MFYNIGGALFFGGGALIFLYILYQLVKIGIKDRQELSKERRQFVGMAVVIVALSLPIVVS